MLTYRFGRVCVGFLAGSSLWIAGCQTTPAAKVSSTFEKPITSKDPKPSEVAFKPAPDKPSPQLSLAYAKLQEQSGNAADARASYEKAVSGNPKSVEAIIGLGRLDYLAGRTADAERRFLEALRLQPKSPLALGAIGQFYSDESRWSEAVGALTQAMQAAPEDRNVRYRLGIALAKTGQMEQAFPHFAQAVGEGAAHYNIGLIMYDKGDIPASGKQFELAVVHDPKLEAAQYWLDEVRRELDVQFAGHQSQSGRGSDRRPVAVQYPARQASAQGDYYPAGGPQGPRIAPASYQQPDMSGPGGSHPSDSGIDSQSWPAGGNPAASYGQHAISPPPSGLTAQQLEQWNNQRAAEAGR